MNSQQVYHRVSLRPRAAIFMKGVKDNVVPGFITRDLVAEQIKYEEGKYQKDVMVCLAYLPLDSVEMPPHAEFKELVEFCSEEKLELLVGSDANAHHTVYGVATTSTQEGRVFVSISRHRVD